MTGKKKGQKTDFLGAVEEILNESDERLTAKRIAGELAVRFAYPPTALGLARMMNRDGRFKVYGRDKDRVRLWGIVESEPDQA